MSLVLKSPGNDSLRSWKVLEFTCSSNYNIGIVPSLGSCLLKNCKTSFCDLVHKTSFVLKDTQSGIIINN